MICVADSAAAWAAPCMISLPSPLRCVRMRALNYGNGSTGAAAVQASAVRCRAARPIPRISAHSALRQVSSATPRLPGTPERCARSALFALLRHGRQRLLGEAPLDLLQLRLHGGAEIDLRLRWRQVLRRLAAGGDVLRAVESGDEGGVLGQRPVGIGVAGIGEIILIAAAERGLVRRRRGEDERALVL